MLLLRGRVRGLLGCLHALARRPRERPHCCTVHFKEGWLLQWFLCCGLKAAPLFWGRMWMLQGLLPAQWFGSQGYVDDHFGCCWARVDKREDMCSRCHASYSVRHGAESGLAQRRAGSRGRMDRGHFQVALVRQACVVGGAVEDDQGDSRRSGDT